MSDEPATPYRSYVDAWLAAEPEARLLRAFAPEASEPVCEARLVLAHQLERILLGTREMRVGAAQLAWWVEELARASRGLAQHPIARRLQELGDGMHAGAVASALADHGAPLIELESVASLEALLAALAPLATALDGGPPAALLARALRRFAALAADARGLVPLDVLARRGASRAELAAQPAIAATVLGDLARRLAQLLDFAGGSRVDRIRLAHARLLAVAAAHRPERALAGRLVLPPIRGLLATWAAARRVE